MFKLDISPAGKLHTKYGNTKINNDLKREVERRNLKWSKIEDLEA